MKVRRTWTELLRAAWRWNTISVLSLASVGGVAALCSGAEQEAPSVVAQIDGEELFLREWIPGDTRTQGGDGLGPVFNESSCVSCHNQGGTGGAGPASKNVDIISAFQNQVRQNRPADLPDLLFRGLFGDIAAPPAQPDAIADAKEARRRSRAELAGIHPGFATAGSVVLHRFGTDEGYEAWRLRMKGGNSFNVQKTMTFVALPPTATPAQKASRRAANRAIAQQELQLVKMSVQQAQFGGFGTNQVGNFVLLSSQRNPTALFGAGALDSVTDNDLLAAAQTKHREFPEISGRAAKLKDGRLGRFGWKAQTASLTDFTLTACAVELGLHVPGHDQAGLAQKPDYKAPGYDLTEEECTSLENYLRDLPAPMQLEPKTKNEAKYLKAGEAQFAKLGCAACHTPKLGEVAGVYSDLLLHDMGDELGDTGQYGVFVPNQSEENLLEDHKVEPFANSRNRVEPTAEELAKTIGALRTEWRTPPLWGVRDSAPYLHDGRAKTLEEAVALHGGEGAQSAQRYFELTGKQRMQLLGFLRSLTAPTTELAQAQ